MRALNLSTICRAASVAASLALIPALCACQSSQMAGAGGEGDGLAEFESGAGRPPTAQTLYRMARILAGKHVEAEAVLRNTIDRYASFTPAYRELAEIQLRKRLVPDAIETLQAGLAQMPNDPVLLNDLGVAYVLDDQNSLAYEQFQQATDLVPMNARYVSNMAMAAARRTACRVPAGELP